MKKSHVFFGLAFLMLGCWATHNYDVNSACYEIVAVGKPLHGEILLDKCKGRTWTMVEDTTTLNKLGYVTEDGGDEEVNTVVWTRVSKGGGIVTLSGKEK